MNEMNNSSITEDILSFEYLFYYRVDHKVAKLIKNLHLSLVPSFKMNCKPFTAERKTRPRLKDLQTIELGSTVWQYSVFIQTTRQR